jgi:hypothetical protein
MRSWSRIVATIGVALLAFQAPTPGQVATGNIRGVVVDTTDAVIPSAKVTLTNTGTGLQRVVMSNESGDFNAPLMPLGDYQIATEVSGFSKKILTGISLQVDQTATIRIMLEPGTATQSIEVTSAAPLLDAQTSSLGQVIENKRILELPLNGRNPFGLGLLAGGTTPFYGLTTNLPFVAGGGRFSANDILIDGVDNNIRNFAGSVGRNGISYIPSVDAVEEFKVKTNNLSAEYGRSAGYTVSATIRAGTNQYHGSLFEFIRNDQLDANNFISNFSGKPRAKFRQNQFGGTIGGAVRFPHFQGRDRTFFFFDYQGTEVRQAAGSSLSDVPPASWRTGNFASNPISIYDPASRALNANGAVTSDPFPNNIIPPNRLDPTVQKYQALIPLPNVGSVESTSRNFISTSPSQRTRKQADVRIDHQLFRGNNLMGRFSFAQDSSPNQGSYVYSPLVTLFNTRNFALSDTHIFSPGIVNEFRFGFNRSNSSQIATKVTEASAFAVQNGLQFGAVTGFPSATFAYSGNGLGANEFSGFGAASSMLVFENSFQWADHLTVIHGSHTLKMGGEVRRFRFDHLPAFPLSGSYVFQSTFTANPSLTARTGDPYADFLLGFPTQVTGSGQKDWSRQRDLYAAPYIQDDWKVSPRLTLNLGLRYDLFTQPVDALNVGGVFDPYSTSDLGRLGVIRLPGKNGSSAAIVQGHHGNIAPRFGFAYQASPKFVVRGGYGLFYSQREQNRQITELANTQLNFVTITTPPVNPATIVTPPIRFTSPLTVEAALTPDFAGYTATNPLAVGTNLLAADINNSRFPMLQQFNLSLQYEFLAGLLVEASYAGSHGEHWVQRVNLNQLPWSAAVSGQNKQANLPYPYINGPIGWDTGNVYSNYQSFNLRIERRFSHGLTFLTNYTVSKDTESGGSGNAIFNQQGDTRAWDKYNLRLERGLSPLDIPQKFVTSALYELPWGPGKRFLSGRGIAGQILGGWKANGILTLLKGFPTDFRYPLNPPIFNTLNRPNRVLGQPLLVAHPSFDQYFNPLAFSAPPVVLNDLGQGIQTFGNAGRAILRGPGSRNLDFSLFKEFQIFERTRLQFRGEAFNLSNTPTFTLPAALSPGLTFGNAAFGKLAGSQTVGRQLQFGLKLLW